MLRAYKYRIYPTEDQQVLLAKHFGCARWVYNYGLAMKTKAYQEKKKLTCIDIANQLTSLKKEEATEWLKEVNSQCLQAALRHLDNAYTKFFRDKKGFPRFKSRNDHTQSFACPQHCSVNWGESKLFIPKFKGGLKAALHRKFEGELHTVTISKNCAGRYFASVLVEDGKELPAKPPIKNAVGIDLGLKSFLVTSAGLVVDNPRFGERSAKRLSFAQRKFSRAVKGSRNREKLRIKVARIHERVTNQRADFLHKLSSRIVGDSQTDTICLETLNVSGMVKNRCLAKGITDVSWSSFVKMIEYKAEWRGKNVLKIGRFEPSSKVCSECGNIKPMPLSERTYSCACGNSMDRDVNAAKNIRNFAMLSGKDFPFEPVKENRASGELPRVKTRKGKTLKYRIRPVPQRGDETGKSDREVRGPRIYSGE